MMTQITLQGVGRATSKEAKLEKLSIRLPMCNVTVYKHSLFPSVRVLSFDKSTDIGVVTRFGNENVYAVKDTLVCINLESLVDNCVTVHKRTKKAYLHLMGSAEGDSVLYQASIGDIPTKVRYVDRVIHEDKLYCGQVDEPTPCEYDAVMSGIKMLMERGAL